jgi:hypothetical protein
MTNQCNAPFCENQTNHIKHSYCGPHRWDREKNKIKAYKELLPLWAYKRCETHGLLRRGQVVFRKSGHHECYACKKIKYPYCPIKNKKYTQKHSNHRKSVRLKKRYGIDNNDYHALLLKQNSCCAICSIHITEHQTKKGEDKRFAVDHCHDSGKVRGNGQRQIFYLHLF